jgi:hypothetical protein
MKKIYFILSIAVSNFCISQNEWNSVNNSSSPMERKGYVAIGTGVLPTIQFVVRDATGAGTKIAFGNNTMVGTYGVSDAVLELSGGSTTAGSFFNLNTNPSVNRSSLTFGISSFGAGIYSGKSGTGIPRPLLFFTDPGTGILERMRIANNGFVGINTTNPTAGLTVNSNVLIGNPSVVTLPIGYNLYVELGILTEKVKVAVKNTANWSDFVFAKDYKLKSLEEVDAFIKLNKHLPGVPSAEEVVKEGIDMATMDAKLLEKIEELTLYMIDLKKEMEVLKKENKALKTAKQ